MSQPTMTDTKMTTAEQELQTIPSAILAAAARGELDLNQVARVVLASRGQDLNGQWVGFDRAAEIHSITNS